MVVIAQLGCLMLLRTSTRSTSTFKYLVLKFRYFQVINFMLEVIYTRILPSTAVFNQPAPNDLNLVQLYRVRTIHVVDEDTNT